MKNKTHFLKQALVAMTLMVAAVTLFSFMPAVSAATTDDTAIQFVSDRTGGATELKPLILTIVNYFLTFLGILAVIMVIFGGVTYVSSAGNDEAVGKAKKIIMYALIGIVIILLSAVLVNTILGAATGK